jgi:hypothetical protein
MRIRTSGRLAGCLAMAVVAIAPAAARAQYVAPPPDPGFSYIFNGTATGSDASFDKWQFASGTAAQSASQATATVDPVEGAILVNTSPFGSYWYTVRPLGDAVIRVHYAVLNTPTSTPNGGVMIRTPDVRYTGANTTAVLASKPTGYNFDVCPLATTFCGLTTPAPATSYSWAGADGPFPPASNASTPPFLYTGAYCSHSGTDNVTALTGTGPLTVNSNADNAEHWSQVYCGHEIQINESLNGGAGGVGASTDPIKTGSVYGFRNLNSKQSRTNERQVKGVYHTMEIRTIGEQFTVLVDGNLINQFDNTIPKIASRVGDPPTMARQLARGYLGLQTHGGTDRISYREVEVKDIAAADIPVNSVAPKVTGTGDVGLPLSCSRGTWTHDDTNEYWITWYRSNPILPSNPRYRAPSQLDYANFTTPIEPAMGTQALPWMDSQIIGTGATYTPTTDDLGKSLYCQSTANNGGATRWVTTSAPTILSAVQAVTDVAANVPAQLSLTLGTPAAFGAFTPALAKDYDASMSANVISTAGDGALTVSDPSATATGHLVNGAFSLPSVLQVKASSAGGVGGALANVGGSAAPTQVLTYSLPISNDAVTLAFRQHIGATDPLRTGSYSKTLTFTLSTTSP